MSFTQFFYKQHFYKQRQDEIAKTSSKIICFLCPRCYPKIIGDILKNLQKQVRLFKQGYMINGNENKVENSKQIT